MAAGGSALPVDPGTGQVDAQALKDLVRRTILEILANEPGIASTPEQPERRALVVFTGAWLGFDESVRQLQKVRDAGIHLDIVQTESSRLHLDQAKITSLGPEVTKNLVSTHPLLIMPTLTVNAAAKVAHGMADNLATNLMHEFILLNRPIVAVRTAACPDDPEKQEWFPNIPPAFAQVLRENLVKLESFGVTLTGVQGLAEQVLAACRRIDAAGASASGSAGGAGAGDAALPDLVSFDLLQTVADGAVLKVARKALVTALARDEADARGIRIERQEG
ncbi:flavoprotein [Propionibacteriaceae bacterium Y1923]|uniref:flavoprotein n=1 Tax=Aestuariimicrobium sp. Y1814 TaxID=3418742 RepID=UPI003C274D6A